MVVGQEIEYTISSDVSEVSKDDDFPLPRSDSDDGLRRMLWSSCLRQRLTLNWKQRSLVSWHTHGKIMDNKVQLANPTTVFTVQNVFVDTLITTNCIHCWSWTANCYRPCIYSCTITLKIGRSQFNACLCCSVTIAVHITSHRVGKLPTTMQLFHKSLRYVVYSMTFNAPSNSHAQYPVLVHLVYYCTATLKQYVFSFNFVHKTEL